MSNTLRIAVTGGSGNIGQCTLRLLIERGHSVVNIDRRPDEVDGVRHVHLDVRRREMLQPLLETCDAVIHLGEISNQRAPFSRDEIFATNTAACATVLQTAADLELRRVVYVSSCQAYGMWDHPLAPPLMLPFDESHPLQPQNVYALSKVANESYARFVGKTTGTQVAIIRFPWVMPEYFASSHRALRWLEQSTGELDGLGTYLHEQDAAMALALAVETDRAGANAYHFSAADVYSSLPLDQRIAKHHPDYPRLPSDWPAFRSPMLLDAARQHLGWEPKHSIHERYRQKKGTDVVPTEVD